MKTSILLVIALTAITWRANAQKLPNVQTASILAPAGIKIDGKATEWNNQFQAYNKATQIYYTMANDAENLYLLAQITDADIINFKTIKSGLKLVIQKNGKNDKNGVSVIYPILKGKGTNFKLRPRKTEIPDTTKTALDSTMKHNNETLGQNVKWIKVTGIDNLDTLSVYNNDGIKAAGLFDIRKAYNIEIAIPLKLLGLSANDASKFSYHIILGDNNSGQQNPMQLLPMPDASPEEITLANHFNELLSQRQGTLFAQTDFWGEYTLAK